MRPISTTPEEMLAELGAEQKEQRDAMWRRVLICRYCQKPLKGQHFYEVRKKLDILSRFNPVDGGRICKFRTEVEAVGYLSVHTISCSAACRAKHKSIRAQEKLRRFLIDRIDKRKTMLAKDHEMLERYTEELAELQA
jgi:hypothetical protein